ncbi:hypothetical protein [Halorubrum sp. Boch-26]|uniref:DUF7310 family coiled-coil domain-containing protein n=1 Tax=Halorubrum sp. Boch-26 TaxID=2994426 RepID=UPI002468B671|nr:hypothetical protein [Halorubrum sp. Boch-26]
MSNATDERSRTSDRGERPPGAEAGRPSDAQAEDHLEERLRAVERALTGSDTAVADLGDDAAAAAEREALASRVAELESRVEELEAATQAIRGYVGSIRAVNREVERRADLALARANRGEEGAHDTGSANETDLSDAAQGDGEPDDMAGDDGHATAVPSEAALDAAVPADDAGQTDARASADWDAADGGNDADGSWRDEALERLRESL